MNNRYKDCKAMLERTPLEKNSIKTWYTLSRTIAAPAVFENKE